MRGTCSVDGCKKREKARGWCSAHYARWQKYGDPLTTRVQVFEKVEARILASARVLPNGCWEWTGSLFDSGYPMVSVDRRTRRAHRVVYEMYFGPIPAGLDLDHQCHNRDVGCAGGPSCPHRRCVNPHHLDAVPNETNAKRSRNYASNKTHCPKGHAYAGENLAIYGGKRNCRACRREARRGAA